MDDVLYLFFERSESSRAAGEAYWRRLRLRTADVDPPTSEQTMRAQGNAIAEWRKVRGERFAELERISQPTLVVNGRNDIMVPSVNSYILAQRIPRAQLIMYPDAGHASHFQYPGLFVDHVSRFLDAEPAFD